MKILQRFGKDFRWKKPFCCPTCRGRRLWGHGFVLRYFIGYVYGLWMKRWRCPECSAVHTVRPVQYSPRTQYLRHTQNRSLLAKCSGNPFLQSVPRQIQQHWMKLFRWKMWEKQNWLQPLEFLHLQLKSNQFFLIHRTIYYETWSLAHYPYLKFALTAKQRPFMLK